MNLDMPVHETNDPLASKKSMFDVDDYGHHVRINPALMTEGARDGGRDSEVVSERFSMIMSMYNGKIKDRSLRGDDFNV